MKNTRLLNSMVDDDRLLFSENKKAKKPSWTLLILICFSAGLMASLYSGPAPANPAAEQREKGVWPALSRWNHSTRYPTLVLFLDPDCEMSHQTAEAVTKLQSQGEKSFDVIVFLTPSKSTSSVDLAELSSLARSPRVQLAPDPDADEASLFGALYSGHAFAFDKNGSLIRSGQIQFKDRAFSMVKKSSAVTSCKLFEAP
ncbi:MAG: hypothetical protein EOP06_01750 [Proteobacteria bacterium]|nr:MAG: hypothetical protein EOP06_01750 [Pseudomonadota bacterium]